MKKHIALAMIIIALCFVTNSYAALNSAIEWDVRATGNANNGGGFKAGASGTDYSTQDAAQYSLTGVTTAAANAIMLHASAAADMVGNICKVTGGTNFTVGYYEITSVVVGVSMTVDRNCTTAAGSAGTVEVGGGTTLVGNISTIVIAGNTIHIKNGTYNETLSVTVAGGNGTPIKWIGYNASHNDVCTGTNRPLFDGQSVRSNCITSAQTNNHYYNIRVTGATSHGVNLNSSNLIYNVKSSANGGSGISCGGGIPTIVYCESSGNTARGLTQNSNAGSEAYWSYFHDNTTEGMKSWVITTSVGCVFESNSAHGLLNDAFSGAYSSLINCVFYNNTGASTDGAQFNDAVDGHVTIVNTVSIDNGRYGFNRTGSTVTTIAFFDYNVYNGNATGGLNNITAGANDSTSAPSFVDKAGGDFTVASGSPCIGTGVMQAALNGLTGDYQWNIGVDQDDNVAAGGGASFFMND